MGNTVFMTGNWWAAISRNGGRTFTHVDPFTAFGGGYGGFCCDQVAIYSPVADATVWVLQYLGGWLRQQRRTDRRVGW